MSRVTVRDFTETDRDSCRELLANLPGWFGIETANRAYIAVLGTFPTAVATIDDHIVGFAALEIHNDQSIELHVIAVDAKHHRRGIGKALLEWAEEFCRKRGAPWFHVKTLGPSEPDEGYERTRLFYLGQGFSPLFETKELWDAHNPALIMVKKLEPG
jgi:GNAT superfamily N-acetyltransferase